MFTGQQIPKINSLFGFHTLIEFLQGSVFSWCDALTSWWMSEWWASRYLVHLLFSPPGWLSWPPKEMGCRTKRGLIQKWEEPSLLPGLVLSLSGDLEQSTRGQVHSHVKWHLRTRRSPMSFSPPNSLRLADTPQNAGTRMTCVNHLGISSRNSSKAFARQPRRSWGTTVSCTRGHLGDQWGQN